jgi:hypothetical protein
MSVSLAEYQRSPHGHIENVVLRDGRTMLFDTTGQKAGVVINGMLVGTLSSGEMVYVPMEEVATISYYDARAAQSVLLMFGGLLSVCAAIFLLSFEGIGI